MNTSIIIGNVGFVGEARSVKTRDGNVSVTDVGVIVNKKYKTGDKIVEETTKYVVPFWNKLSDVAQQHIEVGQCLRISGEVYADAYLDKNGKPAASLKLKLARSDAFEFIGGRPSNRGNARSTTTTTRTMAPVGAGAPSTDDSILDEEIPF